MKNRLSKLSRLVQSKSRKALACDRGLVHHISIVARPYFNRCKKDYRTTIPYERKQECKETTTLLIYHNISTV